MYTVLICLSVRSHPQLLGDSPFNEHTERTRGNVADKQVKQQAAKQAGRLVRGGRVTFSGHGDIAETRMLIKSFGQKHVNVRHLSYCYGYQLLKSKILCKSIR